MVPKKILVKHKEEIFIGHYVYSSKDNTLLVYARSKDGRPLEITTVQSFDDPFMAEIILRELIETGRAIPV